MTRTGPQEICNRIVADVAGSLGCALVDLATGLPLAAAVSPASKLEDATLEVLSAAGVTFFGDDRPLGDDSPALSESTPPGGVEEHAGRSLQVQELQITTEDAYAFMSLLPGAPGQLLMLVTDRAASKLGLGWVGMRQALSLLGDATAGSAQQASETPGS